MQIESGRFVVIGGAGFIGSHVVDQLLDAGASSVLVYDNFSRGSRANLAAALRDPRCRVFDDGADILHRDMLERAMRGADGVFHLAAHWLLQSLEYPRAAFDVNVVGTMNVAEAAIRTGVRRLVYSSSASVYGDVRETPVPESHPQEPGDFYGASKVCGEALLRALAGHARRQRGQFGYVALRYMNVYGQRQHEQGEYLGVVARMLNALDQGQAPTVHGDGTQLLDFIDVRDCARANLLAMQADATQAGYNVGTGVGTTIAELATLLSALHPCKLPAVRLPSGRPQVMARVASTTRALRDLHFQARILLEDGLQSLLDWRAMARGALSS